MEVEETTEKIGKSVDSDKKNDKVTLVSKVGVKKAKDRIDFLYNTSLDIIDKLTTDKNYKESLVMKELVNYLVIREK